MRTHRERGMSIVEVNVAMVVVGGLLVAALNTAGAAFTTNAHNAERQRAILLAQDLMNEMLEMAYEEPVDTKTFGPETGETGGTRQAFDDVDDYHTWSKTPPQYRNGEAIPWATGFQRTVTVEYVNANLLTEVLVADTGVKRITVSIAAVVPDRVDPDSHSTRTIVALDSYRASGASGELKLELLNRLGL